MEEGCRVQGEVKGGKVKRVEGLVGGGLSSKKSGKGKGGGGGG
jgi:hypothetical protein